MRSLQESVLGQARRKATDGSPEKEGRDVKPWDDEFTLTCQSARSEDSKVSNWNLIYRDGCRAQKGHYSDSTSAPPIDSV